MGESQSLQSLITCPQHHDFKLIIEKKVGPPEVVHLYSLTMQEKAAWISDISQVSLLLRNAMRTIRQSDPTYFQQLSHCIFNLLYSAWIMLDSATLSKVHPQTLPQ